MGRKRKLIKKLAKLQLIEGRYEYTARNGMECYGPDRYEVKAVKALVKEAKRILEEAQS